MIRPFGARKKCKKAKQPSNKQSHPSAEKTKNARLKNNAVGTAVEKYSGQSVRVSLSDLAYVNTRFLQKIFKPYLKILCMRLIIFYQRHLSRHTCLYTPTCSQYTLECINNRGVIEGILLGAFRILRCNPFSKGGFDPPKESRYKKWVL